MAGIPILLAWVLTDAATAATVEAGTPPLSVMRWGAPVVCGFIERTAAVPSGVFRAQCDDVARACLVTSRFELDDQGVETAAELARVQPCLRDEERFDQSAHGYRFVMAIAESPPGWVRDARGRIMQFNFDMNRRVWIGAGDSPLWNGTGPMPANRFRADFGVQFEAPSSDGRTLYRGHFLEGDVYLGTFSIDGRLASFDWSYDPPRAPLWLSTFIGQPRRFDVPLNLGGWFEALHLEALRRNGENPVFVTWGAAELSVDLWHSKDLSSFVRVRAGPSLEMDAQRGMFTLKPEATLEGDLTLDRDGFHHVRFEADGEKLFLDGAVTGRPLHPERLRFRAGYEVIFLAINDQPLTLLLEGRSTWRDDLVNTPPGWEWAAIATIRFSFWGPARRSAPGRPDG